jgi:hypothetical protein
MTLSSAHAAEPPLPDRKPAPEKQSAGKPPAPSKDASAKEAQAKANDKNGTPAPAERPSLAWTKIEIDAAKKECATLLEKVAIDYEPLDPVSAGECGAPAPILVKSIGADPAIEISPPATMQCPVAAALDKWFSEVVQPEARALFNSPVIKVRNAADYHCRNRYGKAEGTLSEHGRANALDISVFTLQSETSIALGNSWPKPGQLVQRTPATIPPLPDRNPEMLAASLAAERKMDEAMGAKGPKFETVALRAANAAMKTSTVSIARLAGEQVLEVMKARMEPKAMAATPPATMPEKPIEPPLKTDPDAAAQFMVSIHKGACAYFGTVLGPKANDAHKSHFHLDMIERRTSYCQ